MYVPDPDQPTLVIFCKRPLLHQGKQRLAATLGAEHAWVLAEAFLACALEDAADWPGSVVLSPASLADQDWAAGLFSGARIVPQAEGNLGQRLGFVDRALRDRGARKLLFIGTDAPALTPSHYQSAIQALGEHDVVLSAANDGGVTMMGGRRPWPDLSPLPWSTELLGGALKSCCEAAGLDVGYIPPSYDIDLEQDLRRLREDLVRDPRAARKQLLETLEGLLDRMQKTA